MSRALERVEAEDVTKLHGGIVALRGVSAAFEAGTVTVVEGPNGSGKSTLLSILGTATRPTKGRVVWRPFGDDLAAARAHVGWLGHEALVYPDLTGHENLRWLAEVHGLPPSAVDEVGARIGLGEWSKRPVRSMSRGQKQRVALARAILHGPGLLLLDEPTTGLDVSGVARLVDIVREEAARGAIVVVVTHEAALTTALGGAVLRLERGKRVA